MDRNTALVLGVITLAAVLAVWLLSRPRDKAGDESDGEGAPPVEGTATIVGRSQSWQ